MIKSSFVMLAFILSFSLAYPSYTVFSQKSLSNGYITYENPDFNVKVSYPANWTKTESNLPKDTLVYFHTPVRYSFETPNSTIEIKSYYYNGSLSYLKTADKQIYSQESLNGEIRLLKTADTTLSGYPAFQLEYYDYSDNKNFKVLETYTVKNGEFYQVIYQSQPGEYLKNLSALTKVLNSFRITK